MCLCLIYYKNHINTDIRLDKSTSGRSINLALSERGINALRFIGLDNIIIEELTEPMYGRMIHSTDGHKYSIMYDINKSKVTFYVYIFVVISLINYNFLLFIKY